MPSIATGWKPALLLAALAVAGIPAAGQQRTDKEASIHRELEEIYRADQKDRESGLGLHLAPRDAARRQRVLAIVRNGLLKSADDYHNAAMVLQHGAGPEDYLLAHILASIAAFKGRDDARWLSAAALDRYLRSIHRNQVFGTQYVRSGSGPWEQAPFDRKLLPDTIRSEYGVPPLSEQHKKLEELRRSLGGKK